nr:VP3 [Cat Tien Macrotermes Deltaflexi-like virus]
MLVLWNLVSRLLNHLPQPASLPEAPTSSTAPKPCPAKERSPSTLPGSIPKSAEPSSPPPTLPLSSSYPTAPTSSPTSSSIAVAPAQSLLRPRTPPQFRQLPGPLSFQTTTMAEVLHDLRH